MVELTVASAAISFGGRPAAGPASFTVRAGRTTALTGPSGCGKSTLLRTIFGLERLSGGEIRLDGRAISTPRRPGGPPPGLAQLVAQDPRGALNPRRSLLWSIAEPLLLTGDSDPAAGARAIAAEVGLDSQILARLPEEVSGGQRQRALIARALARRPRLLALDEPTAALDVTVQATVLNLLLDLQAAHGLAYLLVSHDPDVVRYMSDEIVVLTPPGSAA